MINSAGTLLFRRQGGQLQVLLVHPSGNYNRHKPWSIPKGIPDAGESLESAARRETLEEAGVAAGALEFLAAIDYAKKRKRVHCFVGTAAADAAPRCVSWEVDRAEFVPLDEARSLIQRDQAVFLDRLVEWLESQG